MRENLRVIGEKIVENRYDVNKLAMELRMVEDPEVVQRIQNRSFSSMTAEEAEEFTATFVRYLGEAVYGDEKYYFELVTDWSKKAGELAVNEDVPLEESLDGLRFFRKAILQILKQEAEQVHLTIEDVIDICSIIDPLLDRCIYCFSLAYIADHKEVVRKAHANVQQLLMPIVPVSNGAAVLPIIGELDEERSHFILEKALEQCSKLKVTYLIIDLSGIVIIDTMVAHNLFRVVNALKLLGVTTIITGMRAELTQTVVSLGIDFKDITTYSSLQKALEAIGFIQRQLQVK
ncbi:STAS domain-containing protein [Pseudalkalibacillus sp. SCS-8]|uniref:STAS domain-containing protein n=1 Tax=Pseudalkalibacillus nanhaiensis TaxID=3115291 RepID=UPI0032D9C15E